MQTPYTESTALRKCFLIFLILLTSLASCTTKEVTISTQEQARKDSLALHVAVMPTSDCLPLYLAQACGITDSLGLDLRLHTFGAQMDVDTALLGNRVNVAYTDLIRALRLMDRCPIKAFMQGHTRMSLVTLKSKRIHKMHQMKERMVAISRLSMSDYWCDAMLDSAFMLSEDVYRPQVHDVLLRTEMLRTQLMEAAMLPQPHAEWMKTDGNYVIFSSPKEGPHFPTWVMKTDSSWNNHRLEQVELLVKAYELAAKQLQQPRHKTIMMRILEQYYHIPGNAAQKLTFDIPTRAELPNSNTIQQAANFLKKRERLPRTINPDSLIWKKSLCK